VQGFGFHGTQDQLNGIDGYSASAGGFAAGYDILIDPDTRVGLAVSYGQTAVDSDGANTGNKVDLDSYQGMVYGSYLGKGWYLNGTVGGGLHKYDSKRLVALLGQTLSGDYDAWQFSGKVDGGYPIKLNPKATIIPMVSVAYSHLAQDGYTETGGSAALTVADNDTDSFRTGAGAKALFTLSDTSEMSTVLEGRAMWLHEFGDTSQDTTANFAGGGTFTTNGVSIDRNSYNVGASLQFSGKSAQQTITLSYDAEIRDEYLGHTAKLQARFDF
jgi:outer membrane autotransporter protein